MKLLLDTHAFLWYISSNPRHPRYASSNAVILSRRRTRSAGGRSKDPLPLCRMGGGRDVETRYGEIGATGTVHMRRGSFDRPPPPMYAVCESSESCGGSGGSG